MMRPRFTREEWVLVIFLVAVLAVFWRLDGREREPVVVRPIVPISSEGGPPATPTPYIVEVRHGQ